MKAILRKKWLVDPYFKGADGETNCGVVTQDGYSVCRCPRYMTKEDWDAIGPAIAKLPDLLAQRDRLVEALEDALVLLEGTPVWKNALLLLASVKESQ